MECEKDKNEKRTISRRHPAGAEPHEDMSTGRFQSLTIYGVYIRFPKDLHIHFDEADTLVSPISVCIVKSGHFWKSKKSPAQRERY